MEWEELKKQFRSISKEERNVLLVVSKNFGKPLDEWSDEDLKWGLVGCAHDMDNAIDMIIDAEDYEDAQAAGEEYADVIATRAAYELEKENRKTLKGGK